MASPPASVLADAPGRVNLIGEHTDYSGGFVLPTAIPRRTSVRLTPRADRQARVRTSAASLAAEADAAASGGPEATFTVGDEHPRRSWIDYVQGVTWAIAQAGLGAHLRGFDAEVDSSVPLGSGLASSAALEVALLRALRAAFGLDLDDLSLARLGQRAENGFVGAQTGIMDQVAATFADTTSALFVDTRSLAVERVPLPPGADLAVIHSGVTHAHAGGEYNARRADCEEASARLGVPQLRDLSPADLPRLADLPDRLACRARHVITENARVLDAVRALRAGDLPGLGALFAASHASLRDDYAVSAPEVDLLVDIAAADPDVYGARMTGGGFGGAVVLLARAGTAGDAGARVAQRYAERSGCAPALLVPAPPPAPFGVGMHLAPPLP